MQPQQERGEGAVVALDRLREAERARRACRPVRDLFAPDDIEGAYRVQTEMTRRRAAAGDAPTGRKIGLTNPRVQQQLGVTQPDFGTLFTSMRYESGQAVPPDRFLQPRVEAEILFVLADDVVGEGDLSRDRIAGAIDYAVAAIELVDSRIAGWDISIIDTVADNASSGAYLLGTRRVELNEFDPVEETVNLSVNDHTRATGRGSDCLGDPLMAVVWLAETLNRLGRPLRAGEVVLSGAMCAMVPIAAGERISAAFSTLGTVEFAFESPLMTTQPL